MQARNQSIIPGAVQPIAPAWGQHAVVTFVPAGRLLAAGRPAFSPARRTLVCRWDCFASSPA